MRATARSSTTTTSARSSSRSAAPLEQRTTLYGRIEHRRAGGSGPTSRTTTPERRAPATAMPRRRSRRGYRSRDATVELHSRPTLDVVGDRQRAGRRAQPRGRRVPRRARPRQGLDGPDRHRPGRAAVRGDGPGDRDLGRLRRQHDGRHRVVRRARPRSSAGCATTSSATVFAHDIRARRRAASHAPPATDGMPTGRCLIVVTPDAERTLNTYLGAASELGPEDVDPELVAGAQVTYLEGYLWDQPPAKDAFRARGAPRARGRPAGRAHALRRLLRRPSPRRLPRPRRATTSTSCSRTRPRSARSTRSTTSTTRCSACTTTARSPRSPAARRAR